MTLTKLRYFLFLLINVVFIFLFASTYWQLVRDLANAPMKIPEKLAAALQQGTARYAFSLLRRKPTESDVVQTLLLVIRDAARSVPTTASQAPNGLYYSV